VEGRDGTKGDLGLAPRLPRLCVCLFFIILFEKRWKERVEVSKC